MPTERLVEIPWALSQLPQSGAILDIGSCEAVYIQYLEYISNAGVEVHLLDARDCHASLPGRMRFHHSSLIGNGLSSSYFDAVMVLSTLEHVGLPHYGQAPFSLGDQLALAEIWRLLKPGGRAIITVPVGQSKIMGWYRQYDPQHLRALLAGWNLQVCYWGYNQAAFVPISEREVEAFDYRDTMDGTARAGAVAGVIAIKPAGDRSDKSPMS